MVFNKQKFAKLLRTSLGDRSINKYGNICNVDPGYISRLLRCKINTPPSPGVIKKLADFAENDITYEDIMEAAGYLPSSTEEEIRVNFEQALPGLKEIFANTVLDMAAQKIPKAKHLSEEEKQALALSLVEEITVKKVNNEYLYYVSIRDVSSAKLVFSCRYSENNDNIIEQEQPSTPSLVFSQNEFDLIKKYRALDERGRQAIDKLLEYELQYAPSQNHGI